MTWKNIGIVEIGNDEIRAPSRRSEVLVDFKESGRRVLTDFPSIPRFTNWHALVLIRKSPKFYAATVTY
jgi:hypothetical protein